MKNPIDKLAICLPFLFLFAAACTPPAGSHLAIVVDSTSVLTCESVRVTISGHYENHTEGAPGADVAITLSTSTSQGVWSNPSEGAFVDNGNGNATYTFADNSSVDLDFNHASVGNVNFNISGPSSTSESASEDPTVTFVDSGFRFVDALGNAIANQMAGKESATYYLQAIETNPVNPQECIAGLPAGDHDIELAAECNNPDSCTAGIPVTVTSTSATSPDDIATNNDNGGDGADTYTPLTLMTFDANARTAFSFNYADAGRIQLHARHELVSGSGEYIAGNSQFVVSPAGLCVEALDTDGVGSRAAECVPLDRDCSIYEEAGDNFTLRISGKVWVSDTEEHSAFCDNTTTANFQLEGIGLSSALSFPVGGDNATLSVSGVSVSSPGFAVDIEANGYVDVVETTIDNAGVFRFTATPPANSYMGVTIPASDSADVGRFIPDHFILVDSMVEPADTAGDYSYIGQQFTASLTLEAVDADGNILTNYRGGIHPRGNHRLEFLDGDAVDDSVDLKAVDLDPLAPIYFGSTKSSVAGDRFAAAGLPEVTWGNGEVSLTETLTITRGSSYEGPYSNVKVGLTVSDMDSVSLRSSDYDLDTDGGGIVDARALDGDGDPHNVRYGRAYFPPVYGPELPLDATTKIPFELQYYDSSVSRFVRHTDDSQSPYDTSVWSLDSCADPDGADSLQCADVDVVFPLSATTVSDGVYNNAIPITILRPAKAGSLNITIAVDDWLKYPWSGDAGDEHPTTLVNFGRYRGNDHIIYWRELNR